MNRTSFFAAPFFLLTLLNADNSPTQGNRERWLINRIEARVNGSNIFASDLAQPQLNNDLKPISLKQAIRQELLVQRAVKTHVAPSSADIERQITASKIENGMTDLSDEDFEKQLKGMTGLSLAQYKQQVWRTLGAEQVKRAEIMDKIVVTSQEVEAYYQAHPLYTTQEFKLRIATLPDEPEHQGKTTKQLMQEGLLCWDEMGWMQLDQMASQYSFIKAIKPQTYSEPKLIDSDLVIVHVQDVREPRLLGLTERYNDIAALLTEDRTKGLVSDLEEALTQKATVVFPPESVEVKTNNTAALASMSKGSPKK